MENFQAYRYPKLAQPDNIRLIRLNPAASPLQKDLWCELREYSQNEIQEYEALSWSWGLDTLEEPLYINNGNDEPTTRFMIPPNLGAAMRALRYENQPRYIWIDFICINQKDVKERNDQVPLMDRIYGNSVNVCIWLGEKDEKSMKALAFIRTIVRKLWAFDDLCSDKSLTSDWEALISIMRKQWFSRRWVIQEIALARKGMLYCGRDNVPWEDFADAVSLFIEVESASHRLSEIMRLDEKYHHVPEFFGEIPYLGASLLVDATSNLFRKTNKGKREPLSSLEYLVSKLAVFDATQPRDIIYALLAISKDTTPKSVDEESQPEWDNPAIARLRAWARRYSKSQTFSVDYRKPIVDVYKDFIAFSISKSDPSRALDILCRPWAPRITRKADRAGMAIPAVIEDDSGENERIRNPDSESDSEHIVLPSWIPSLSDAAFKWVMHPDPVVGRQMKRRNADPLVGLPNFLKNYDAAGSRGITKIRRRFFRRPSYNSMLADGFILDSVKLTEEPSRLGHIPTSWLIPAKWKDPKNEEPPEDFWRTLVADRGPNGQNPPPYYRRACRECLIFGCPESPTTDGNPLDTSQLIDQGRCSIIAEFLRRVRSVIWNRCLMITEDERMGLVNQNTKPEDLICIMYGCTVPLILRKHRKSDDQIQKERQENEEATKVEAAVLIQQAWRRRKRAQESLENIRPRLITSQEAPTTKLPVPLLSVAKSIAQHVFTRKFWLGLKSRTINSFGSLQVFFSFVLTAIRLIWLTWILVQTKRCGDIYDETYFVLGMSQVFRLLYSDDFYDEKEGSIILKAFRRISPKLTPARWKMIENSTSFLVWMLVLQRQLHLYESIPKEAVLTISAGDVDHAMMDYLVSLILLFPYLPEIYWACARKAHMLLTVTLDQAIQPAYEEEPDRYYYEVIGECYVHGMMNGEALHIQNNNAIKTIRFELR